VCVRRDRVGNPGEVQEGAGKGVEEEKVVGA
jgi:hypothetical protein